MSLFAERELTLDDARRLAVKHSLKLQSSQETVMSAKALQRAAFTNFLPNIQAAGTYMRVNETVQYEKDLHLDALLDGMAQANPGLQTDAFYATLVGMLQQGYLPNQLSLQIGQKDNYLFTLSGTQPLFMGGKVYNQYRLAKQASQLAKANQSLTTSQVIDELDQNFCQLLTVQEKCNLAKQYYQTVLQHVTDLQNLLHEGMVTRNDLLKAEVAENEASLKLLKATNALKLVQMALCQKIGYPLSDSLRAIDVDSTQINTVLPPVPIDQVLAHRSEIAALKTSTDMSKTTEKLVLSRYLPNVVLQANYTTLRPNPYNSLKDEFGDDWSISLLGQWELFHWNDRGFQLSAVKHQTKNLALKLQETSELIELESMQAYNQYLEAIAKVTMTKSHVLQATENLKMTKDKFTEGLTSSSEVLDAQVLWEDAITSNIEALSDYRTQQSHYLKVTGQTESLAQKYTEAN